MSGAINLTNQSAFAWIKQPDLNAISHITDVPRTFAATSDGAAGGTTIISTVIGSYFGSDDDLCGRLIEVVTAANASAVESGAPTRRMITAYDDASDTLTIEALPWQVSDGDTFKILEAGVTVSEDTGGSTTEIVDADRDEAADTWIGNTAMGGPYLVPVTCTTISESSAYLITDSASDGTITAPVALTSTVGDLFEIWQFPEIQEGLPGTFNVGEIENPAINGRIAASQESFVGNRDGEIPIALLWRGPGSSRVGEKAESDIVLASILDATDAGSDETIASGTSTTSVNVGSAVTAGSAWLTEAGDVCIATNAADPFTPSPSLRVDPADGTDLYSMRTFTPSDALNYAISARVWDGKGHKITAYGCAPKFSVSGERGAPAKIATPLTVGDWYAVADTRQVDPITPNVSARGVSEIRVNINGTEFSADKASFDIAPEFSPRSSLNSPNQMAGFDLTRYMVTGSVTIWLDDTTIAEYQRFINGSRSRLLIQFNTVPGDPGVLALWVNRARYTGAERADASGVMQVALPWRCVLDPSSTLDEFIVAYA